MRIYNGYAKKNNKLKKLVIAISIVLGLFLVFVAAVGIIKGSKSYDRQQVSDAISENAVLKSKISELENQVADLENQVNILSGELAAMPTQIPVEETVPEPVNQSPRQ